MDAELTELIEALKHPRTSKRRAAAQKLRKLGRVEAGPALFEALEVDIKREETWETQYQIVRAIGECNYKPALPKLIEIAADPNRKTLELSAAGMAIVWLARKDDHDSGPVLSVLQGDYHWLVKSGAITAVAMLRMRFPTDVAAEVINLATFSQEAYLQHLAIACAGWHGPIVDSYLDRCERSHLDFVREAASMARRGIYQKINII